MSGLSELSASLLAGNQPEHGLLLDVGDCCISIRTNSEPLVERLLHYFRHLVAETGSPSFEVVAIQAQEPDLGLEFSDWPREGGKVGRKDTIADVEGGRVVRKVRTGMQFLFGGATRLAIGDCLTNDNQVINFVNAQYMTWLLDRGWTLCHAAGVVTDGCGLAVAGMSGGGKSTLALHLMSHGFRFTSNDRLLIRREGDRVAMAGIPKLPRINPGTALNNPDLEDVIESGRRNQLADLEEDELWELEEKYDVDIAELFGSEQFEMRAPLQSFLILNWSRNTDEPTRIRRVDIDERRDLLRAVMKSPGPFYLPRGADAPPGPLPVEADEYVAVMKAMDVYEATGAVDFGAAVEACAEMFTASERPRDDS